MISIRKPADRLLTAKQVGEILGVTPETVKRWVRKGILPCIRLNSRNLRFGELAIQTWIAEKRDKK